MKIIVTSTACLVLFSLFLQGQTLSLSFYDGNGVNILDVEKSQGWVLEDWNTYSNQISLEGLYVLESGLTLGGELGAHRLYYWERRDSYYGYYHWGTMWTYNLGFIVGYTMDKITLKTGIDLRDYSDGSGIAPGFLFAGDYAIQLADKLSIPIGIRADVIMAKALTVSPNLIIGLRYRIL